MSCARSRPSEDSGAKPMASSAAVEGQNAQEPTSVTVVLGNSRTAGPGPGPWAVTGVRRGEESWEGSGTRGQWFEAGRLGPGPSPTEVPVAPSILETAPAARGGGGEEGEEGGAGESPRALYPARRRAARLAPCAPGGGAPGGAGRGGTLTEAEGRGKGLVLSTSARQARGTSGGLPRPSVGCRGAAEARGERAGRSVSRSGYSARITRPSVCTVPPAAVWLCVRGWPLSSLPPGPL